MMDIDLFTAKVSRKLGLLLGPRIHRADLRKIEQSNLHSNRGLLDSGGPVVSLTTHGDRTQFVYRTIESIARGNLRPSRMILWLDSEKQIQNLPAALERLKRRGLEIYLTDNFGPHTKYFPYVTSITNHTVPLVTADDDIIYPRYWLSALASAYGKDSSVINCYRAHVVDFTKEGVIAPYAQWEACESRKPAYKNFATGVSGVIYPPPFLDSLRDLSTAFLRCARRADDIWLHACALRSGYKIKQIVRIARHFPIVSGTQEQALMHSNNFEGGNDAQIKTTYTRQDVDLMLSV